MFDAKSTTTRNDISEAAILGRVFAAENGSLSKELARQILKVCFGEADQARMEELARRSEQGLLTAKERKELTNYVKVGDYIAILHSKARQALKKHKRLRRTHD